MIEYWLAQQPLSLELSQVFVQQPLWSFAQAIHDDRVVHVHALIEKLLLFGPLVDFLGDRQCDSWFGLPSP